MKNLLYPFLSLLLIASCTPKEKPLSYPEVRKDSISDEYFGVKVNDPYRWLEDDNSEETKAWVEAQNKLTFDYLAQIPFRDKIKERLTQLWDYERFSAPFREGKYYFYYYNSGVQNQDVLFMQEGLDAGAKVFIDPNTLSSDGTVSLGNLSVSKNAAYLAYSVSSAGSDWNEIRVMTIPDGKLLNDHIKWVKFSGISWLGNGFFYSRYDQPAAGKEYSGSNEFHKVYYHTIGTTQEKDILIFDDKTKAKRNFYAGTTDDENALIVSETESTTGNSLWFYPLDTNANHRFAATFDRKKFRQVAAGFDKDYDVVDFDGKLLYLLTNRDAPANRFVSLDPFAGSAESLTDIIPEGKNVLQSVSSAGGKWVGRYLSDACSELKFFSREGKEESTLALPSKGTVGSFNGKKQDSIAFYSFTSFTFPSTIFKYDFRTGKSEEYKKPQLAFNPTDFVTEQLFCQSKDGTQIPFFITRHKDTKPNKSTPAFLYGYGGFNISLTPGFKPERMIFPEQGGIFVQANIRGGGEYGEDWHMAGTTLKKQNVFDDFISVAEFLVSEGYTSPQKLAISGRSNGGLLVGACMTQRPDLFAVALPAVGVLDMLRYHQFTIGWAWATDYGTSKDSVQFAALYKYSPLHNVKEQSYPATLVTTADHDDRVVPAHSFKFISELQSKQQGANPVLIRVDVNAGHGAGKPTAKKIEEEADILGFVFKNLKHSYK